MSDDKKEPNKLRASGRAALTGGAGFVGGSTVGGLAGVGLTIVKQMKHPAKSLKDVLHRGADRINSMATGSVVGGTAGGALGAKHGYGKSMKNQMKKQALLGAISGSLAAKDNRRVGGAVSGAVAGDLIMSDIAHRIDVRGPAAAVLKGAAGGIAGYAYGKYHTKKADTKQDIIHTSTIGAVGLGTGVAAAKIIKAVPKIGNSVKATGALIGGMGLVGDYGAVKFNKALDAKMTKTASNKYLEKVAETYDVKGHSGYHGRYPTPNVHLERDQYRQYAHETDGSKRPLLTGLAVGAPIAALTHKVVSNNVKRGLGGKPGAAAAITGLGGYFLGKSMGKEKAHNKALENLGVTHPWLANKD